MGVRSYYRVGHNNRDHPALWTQHQHMASCPPEHMCNNMHHPQNMEESKSGGPSEAWERSNQQEKLQANITPLHTIQTL